MKGTDFPFHTFFHKIFIDGIGGIAELKFGLIKKDLILAKKERDFSLSLGDLLKGGVQALELLLDKGVVGVIDPESFIDGMDFVEDLNPGPAGLEFQFTLAGIFWFG
ncbi:MAG: hypothetical protein MUP70_17760 [Candidatus Aminicenantes bacterium]|nr:hypothetical protein [Candidatus Aminicenantes bacterium]